MEPRGCSSSERRGPHGPQIVLPNRPTRRRDRRQHGPCPAFAPASACAISCRIVSVTSRDSPRAACHRAISIDLRLREARTEPSLPGAEAKRPLLEHARLLRDFAQPLTAPIPSRFVPVPEHNAGHVPSRLRATHPGSLWIELLDGTEHRRTVPGREDDVVADLETHLRSVEVSHNRAQRRSTLGEEVPPADPQPGTVLTQHGGIHRPACDHVPALAASACVGPHHRRTDRHPLVVSLHPDTLVGIAAPFHDRGKNGPAPSRRLAWGGVSNSTAGPRRAASCRP